MSGTSSEPLTPLHQAPYHRMVQAVAGAGKTTDLIGTFIQFCEKFHVLHGRFPRVVLCTFTRKATLEIRERIQRKLLAENKLELYFHVQKQNQVLISTIHGVFYQLLQSVCRHPDNVTDKIKFDPRIQLESAQHFAPIKKHLLRELLFGSEQNSALLETFKFKQLLGAMETLLDSSVLHPKALTQEMIFSDVQEELEQFQKLCRSVSNHLADLQAEKWQNLHLHLTPLIIHPLQTQKDIPQFWKTLQNFKEQVSRKPTVSRKEPEFDDNEREIYDELFAIRDALLKNPIYRGQNWDQIANANHVFLSVYKQWSQSYRNHQMRISTISFQDLEHYVLQILTQNPDSCDHFMQQWDYWMIDEYQDTSPLQNHVLNLLTQGKPQFVVGDPQQSIYYFRGADQTLFTLKKQQMTSLAAQFDLKNKNHRSHADLISSFNGFFAQRQTQTHFTPMTPYLERKAQFSTQLPRTSIYVAEKNESFNDIELALYRCQELIQHGVDCQDICVLSKNNSYLQKFVQASNRVKIPVQLYSSQGFAERREVLDLISYLKFLINPHDDLNLLTLLRSPYVGLSDQEIYDFCQKPRELKKSLFESRRHDLEKTLAQFLLTDLELAAKTSLIDMAYRYVTQHGLLHVANEVDLSHQVQSNLFKLIDLMEAYQRSSAGYWFGFFDQLENTKGSDQEMGVATPTLSSSRIHVMTIHASKGLEFNHVILIGCDRKSVFSKTNLILHNESTEHFSLILKNTDQENLVPLSMKKNLDQIRNNEKAELERTFYVAITRAKETLTLCGRKQKNLDPNCYFQFVSRELSALQSQDVMPMDSGTALKFFTEAPVFGPLSWKTLKKPTKFLSPLELSANPVAKSLTPSAVTSKTQTLHLRSLLAMQTGTNLHKYLQSLQNYVRQNPEIKEISDWIENREILFTSGQERFRQIIAFLWKTQEIPFQDILLHGFSEWSFEYRDQNHQLIRGQIDLWAIVKNEIWLVDYKSGITHNTELYQIQLGLYEEALRSIRKFTGTVHKAIVKLDEFKIHRIS